MTDDLDRNLLNTFARVWFGEHMFSDKFCFYKGYGIPKGKSVDEYVQYIEQLPLVDTPEVKCYFQFIFLISINYITIQQTPPK